MFQKAEGFSRILGMVTEHSLEVRLACESKVNLYFKRKKKVLVQSAWFFCCFFLFFLFSFLKISLKLVELLYSSTAFPGMLTRYVFTWLLATRK